MKAYLWKSCAQKDSRSRRARDEKGEAAHLFGISLSSVKRYARAWSTYVVNLGQGQPTCRDDEGCAPPPDRSPPSVITRPWHVRVNSLPKLPEEVQLLLL